MTGGAGGGEAGTVNPDVGGSVSLGVGVFGGGQQGLSAGAYAAADVGLFITNATSRW